MHTWRLVLVREHEDVGDQVVCVEARGVPRPARQLELRRSPKFLRLLLVSAAVATCTSNTVSARTHGHAVRTRTTEKPQRDLVTGEELSMARHVLPCHTSVPATLMKSSSCGGGPTPAYLGVAVVHDQRYRRSYALM